MLKSIKQIQILGMFSNYTSFITQALKTYRKKNPKSYQAPHLACYYFEYAMLKDTAC